MITPVAVEPGNGITRFNQQVGQLLAQIGLSRNEVSQRLPALRAIGEAEQATAGVLVERRAVSIGLGLDDRVLLNGDAVVVSGRPGPDKTYFVSEVVRLRKRVERLGVVAIRKPPGRAVEINPTFGWQ